jgi:hypothetical protein
MKANKYSFKLLKIEDTTNFSYLYLSPNEMQRAKNDIRTLQKIRERANLNSSYKKFNYYSESSNELIEYKNKCNYPNSGFTIYIDTVNELTIEYGDIIPFLPLYDINEKNSTKKFEDSLRLKIEIENIENYKKYVKAIPIYIVNHLKKSILISEQDGELFLIQEALDKNGVWQPIEFYSYSSCGNSFGEYVLRSNYYLMTTVYKYKGNFETLLRIKIASGNFITYSKPFKGSINLSQFKKVKIANSYANFLEKSNFNIRDLLYKYMN